MLFIVARKRCPTGLFDPVGADGTLIAGPAYMRMSGVEYARSTG